MPRVLPAALSILLAATACAGEPVAPAASSAGGSDPDTGSTPDATTAVERPDAAAESVVERPAQPFNVLGREDAPVVMIEFGDLQCGYCARYATYTFPELRRRYIETGKLRYTARDLPLPIHPYAVPAAAAARCAGEQGKFWEYRDALFAARGHLGTEPYAQIARELGLDAERLDACRRESRHAAAIGEDVRIARTNGITSTPSFVIGRIVDGRLLAETVSGAKPIESFAEKIEALLGEGR